MFLFSCQSFAFLAISIVFETATTERSVDDAGYCTSDSGYGCAEGASLEEPFVQEHHSAYLETAQMRSIRHRTHDDLLPCTSCNTLTKAITDLVYQSSKAILPLACKGFIDVSPDVLLNELPLGPLGSLIKKILGPINSLFDVLRFNKMCDTAVKKVIERTHSIASNIPFCGAIGMCMDKNKKPEGDLMPCRFCNDVLYASRKLALQITKEVLKLTCEPMWNLPLKLRFKDMCQNVIDAIIKKIDSMVGSIPFCSAVNICLKEDEKVHGVERSFKYAAASEVQYLFIDQEEDSNWINDLSKNFPSSEIFTSMVDKFDFDLAPIYNSTAEWIDTLYDEFITEECAKKITHPHKRTEITAKLKSGQFFGRICKQGTSTLAKVLANDQYKKIISAKVREMCSNSQDFQEVCQLLDDGSFELVFKFLSDSLNSTNICDEINFGSVKSLKEYIDFAEPFFKYYIG